MDTTCGGPGRTIVALPVDIVVLGSDDEVIVKVIAPGTCGAFC
jgi:hypothetical protein